MIWVSKPEIIKEEDEAELRGGRDECRKRKFSEIDNDKPLDHSMRDINSPDSSSAPMIIISIGRYELKVYEASKKKNIIAVLDSGTDKNSIINLLITAMSSSDVAKKLIIFLDPIVNLVKQQYCEIKTYANLAVEEYFGAKRVNNWTSQHWEEEISKYDVLVMTPQILLDALRSDFLKLEMVCLLVINECHRTTGNHPYAKIMKEFYHKTTGKPKIFGLTVSGAIRKDQESELERLMDSQILNPEESKRVKKFAAPTKGGPIIYDPPPYWSLELKEKLETLHFKFDDSLQRLQEMEKNSFPDIENKFKGFQKRLFTDYIEILHCLDNLGLKCAYLGVEVCLEKILKEESETNRECSIVCKKFLEDALSTIKEYMQPEDQNSGDLQQNKLSAVDLGRVSPKLRELLRLLDSFRGQKQTPCLILVERIMTAEVIERFVKKEASLAYINVSRRTQTEILYFFHPDKVNLLFITDVVEEGFYVPKCSCVVYFDLPKTVCSYSQFEEEAKQSNSKSIMFLERGNTKQREHLHILMQRDTDLTRDSETRNVKLCPSLISHSVKATGATITRDSSIAVLKEVAATQTKIIACREAFGNNLLQCSAKDKVASSKSKSSTSAAVIGPINMRKGGPRVTLRELCKKHRWPVPTYDTWEERSRTAFEFDDGNEKWTSFSSFVSTVTVRIPNREAVICAGEARRDKKSSCDSAVMELFYELERCKIIIIQRVVRIY